MKIRNFDGLAKSDLRKASLQIAEAGLNAIDTKNFIKENIHLDNKILTIKGSSFDLSEIEKLVVIGIGKCSLEAGLVLEDILSDKITSGIVMDMTSSDTLKRLKSYQGDHPFPSERNIYGTKAIIELLTGLTEKDLVLMIISGGGSTLLCQPDNMTCQDESAIIGCLFKEGADIQDINIIRKHISYARGGFLAKYAYPAKVVSIIFSDIPGNNIEFVASGPTIKDNTTAEDARAIINKYEIANKCGFQISTLIETPKKDEYFANVENILFLSNEVALEAMSDKAKELGFNPNICSSCLVGDAAETGVKIAKQISQSDPKTVLLYGGETTVIVKHPGKGGRNQELALATLDLVKEDTLVMGLASDGVDNTSHAGGLCDIITKNTANKLGLSATKCVTENCSYDFFEKTGDYIDTGPTGSNVSDLVIAIRN